LEAGLKAIALPDSANPDSFSYLTVLYRARIFKRLWSPGIDSKK
jgi:hypothetical protein